MAVSKDGLSPVEVRGSAEVEQLFRQLALPVTFRAEVRCLLLRHAACVPHQRVPYRSSQLSSKIAVLKGSPTCPAAMQDAGNKRPPFRAPFSPMVPELVRIVRGHVVDSGA